MPWFPDFTSAAELARRQTRAAGQADPVAEYFAALNEGDAHAPGDGVAGRGGDLRPPRGRGPRAQGSAPVRQPQPVLAGRAARADRDRGLHRRPAAGRSWNCWPGWTTTGGKLMWPVAVVAESPDDSSVVFRTYCSQWPVDEQRHVRPPILKPGGARPGDVVGRYQAALAAGTPRRWWAPSHRMGTGAGPPARATPTAVPPSCARFSPGVSARAAASGCSTAP